MSPSLERLPHGTGYKYYASTTIKIVYSKVNTRVQGGSRDCFPGKLETGKMNTIMCSLSPK
eukprot:2344167-Ditylum_brightwellii.AAC.1